jgi:hypothetical protein
VKDAVSKRREVDASGEVCMSDQQCCECTLSNIGAYLALSGRSTPADGSARHTAEHTLRFMSGILVTRPQLCLQQRRAMCLQHNVCLPVSAGVHSDTCAPTLRLADH